ncbi:MAG: hypothetical protein WBG90_18285 [Saonia sp.]
MSNKHELETGNKLLMLQGINLIYNGLEFLNWMTDIKDMNTLDALTILRDRFHYFRDCAFTDGRHDYLFIDKMKDLAENVQYGYKVRDDIEKRLDELRKIVVDEHNAEKAKKGYT